jgi:beta-phosphoglucomutase-like phosphatase (HAD superfamily)
VDAIDAILFEPVGALAEFPEGSQRYWDRVLSLASSDEPLGDERTRLEGSEIELVERALVYEDALPALTELQALGVRLIATTSLCETALTMFLERASLSRRFHDRWSRDTAGGVGHIVLAKAMTAASLVPERVLFLADTEAGVRVGQRAGVNPILMMNDPDEAMRLTSSCKPAGGVVSLHELPDFVRFVSARSRAAMKTPAR